MPPRVSILCRVEEYQTLFSLCMSYTNHTKGKDGTQAAGPKGITANGIQNNAAKGSQSLPSGGVHPNS